MSYLQEFGYKVIPVNPFSTEKKINGEIVVESLKDIKNPIDIVNVFRPSSEIPKIANEAINVKTKVLWLQFGIHDQNSKTLVESKNIKYVANKCIKQEYQRLFLKMSPVFPALK
jgi:predicted CoA-binding protein